MGHIFISYSRQDQAAIEKIAGVLVDAGADIWIDRQGIAGGSKWRPAIVDAIESADVVLLALSPNSVRSDNVRKELDLTEEFKKKILPVEIERASIPKEISYQLVGLQRIDLYSDFKQGARQMLDALGLRPRGEEFDATSKYVLRILFNGVSSLYLRNFFDQDVEVLFDGKMVGRGFYKKGFDVTVHDVSAGLHSVSVTIAGVKPHQLTVDSSGTLELSEKWFSKSVIDKFASGFSWKYTRNAEAS
jgi:TIR domain